MRVTGDFLLLLICRTLRRNSLSVRPDNRSAPCRWNVGLDNSLISEERGEILAAIDQSEMFIIVVLLEE